MVRQIWITPKGNDYYALLSAITQILFLILLQSEINVNLSLWLNVTDIYLKGNDYKSCFLPVNSLSNCIAADESHVIQAQMFVSLRRILHFPILLFFISLASADCAKSVQERAITTKYNYDFIGQDIFLLKLQVCHSLSQLIKDKWRYHFLKNIRKI